MRAQLRSRRMFLQGAGGLLLAIPTLSSLLSRAERARAQTAAAPVRYVQWTTNHGQYDSNFWPASEYDPTDPALLGGKPVSNVKARELASIPGPLSPVLGDAFDPVRAKLNLVRGLDLPVGAGYHNACVPTCGSWPRKEDHVPGFSYSVDSVLEQSDKIYPVTARVPALRLTPGVSSAYKWGSFCWTTRNGTPFKLPAYDTTEGALRAVFGDAAATADAARANRLSLTDSVIEDYRRVAGSPSLGASDKQLLTQYMDLLADVQRRTEVVLPGCKGPELPQQVDFDVLHKNAIDISIAAMMCGATRIVAYHCYQGSPEQYDEETFHAWSHADPAKHCALMIYRYKQLANLLRAMDQVREPDGRTLLDNSLVYAGNELSDPGHGVKHLQNMPILLAGGAGGKLATGYYVDYARRLMNSVLVTIFQTMGLGPADYERNDVVGFGDYTGNNIGAYSTYLGDEERRKPLPFIYRG
jgi:hypothetical protein